MIIFIALAIAIGAYALCSWLSYRVYVADFMREYPTLAFSLPHKGLKYDGGARLHRKKADARAYAILGPAALLVLLIITRCQHGWSTPSEEELRPLAKEEWGCYND